MCLEGYRSNTCTCAISTFFFIIMMIKFSRDATRHSIHVSPVGNCLLDLLLRGLIIPLQLILQLLHFFYVLCSRQTVWWSKFSRQRTVLDRVSSVECHRTQVYIWPATSAERNGNSKKIVAEPKRCYVVTLLPESKTCSLGRCKFIEPRVTQCAKSYDIGQSPTRSTFARSTLKSEKEYTW